MKKITILAAAMMFSMGIYAADSASIVTNSTSQSTMNSIGHTVVSQGADVSHSGVDAVPGSAQAKLAAVPVASEPVDQGTEMAHDTVDDSAGVTHDKVDQMTVTLAASQVTGPPKASSIAKVETKVDLQSPVGSWMTVNDDEVGGKPAVQSIVQIMIDPTDKSKLIGKILVPFVNVTDGEKQIPDVLCTHCTGELKGKPIVGLKIIMGAKKSGSAEGSDGATYKGGEIMDPSNGKTYTLKMWTEENGKELKVRSYIMFFYRTQTWYRVDAADAQKYGAECGIGSGAKSYKYVGVDGKVSNKDLWKTCSNIP